jgi:hypothetical protein
MRDVVYLFAWAATGEMGILDEELKKKSTIKFT